MKINSSVDLHRYVSSQLKNYESKLYGYEDHNAFEDKATEALHEFLQAFHNWNYGDELPELDWEVILHKLDLKKESTMKKYYVTFEHRNVVAVHLEAETEEELQALIKEIEDEGCCHDALDRGIRIQYPFSSSMHCKDIDGNIMNAVYDLT